MARQSLHGAHYDLLSALYHLNRSERTCSQYALDAKRAQDEELAAFFREAQAQHQDLAARAERLLLKRLGERATRDERDEACASPDTRSEVGE